MKSPLVMTTNQEYYKVFLSDFRYMHELVWPITVHVIKDDVIVDKENLTSFEEFLVYLAEDYSAGYTLCQISRLNEWKVLYGDDRYQNRLQLQKLIGIGLVCVGTFFTVSSIVNQLPWMTYLTLSGIFISTLYFSEKSIKTIQHQTLALSDELSLPHQADILSVFSQSYIPIEKLMIWNNANGGNGISAAQLHAHNTRTMS